MSDRNPDLFPEESERYYLQRAERGTSAPKQQRSLLQAIREFGLAVIRPKRSRPSPGQFEVHEGGVVSCPVSDSRRHHPKSFKLCSFDQFSSPFWANLLIGSRGQDAPPANVPKRKSAKSALLSKNSAPLVNAIHDLNSLRDFYQPVQFGSPFVAFDPENSPGILRSQGYFCHTVVLADPTWEAVKTGVASIAHWLKVNSEDPEFRSFQLNIFFSGHGADGGAPGLGGIEIADGVHPISALAELLHETLIAHSVQGERCRIRLLVDCCFAAAVVRDFNFHFGVGVRRTRSRSRIREFFISDLFCSSLGDERSWDDPRIGNSLFTAAYLRENSAMPVGARHPNLDEISIRTRGAQNPVLISFVPEDPTVRVPAMNLLPPEELARSMPDAGEVHALARQRGLLGDDNKIDAVDYGLLQAELLRRITRRWLRSPHVKPPVPYHQRTTRWD